MILILLIFVHSVSCQTQLWTPAFNNRAYCDDKRATACYYVRPNLNQLHNESFTYITVPGLGFDHVTFYRRINWQMRGQYLVEFEIKKSSKHYGHITLLYNDRNIWGFIDFENNRFSLENMPTMWQSQNKGIKILKQWGEGNFSTDHQGRQGAPPSYGDLYHV